MYHKISPLFLLPFLLILMACHVQKPESAQETKPMGLLKISNDKRWFVTEDGEPFFWLGDTGWLFPSKLDREDAEIYLEDRKQKGFNVIQVSVLHTLNAVNAYGDSALINKSTAKPLVTSGNNPENPQQYDYWDHFDYMVELAAKKNLYMAIVPVWGTNVKKGGVSEKEAEAYAEFLAKRYKDKANIIWLNGGDINGKDSTNIWQTIGKTLKKYDPNHLVTFHPRGRTTSSLWFHNEPWLDFNMFQSGHRRYDQDTAKAELRFGEDNWKYVAMDYQQDPVKPTLDGEPSYEGIVQGLHDNKQPMWEDKDVRRYAYWSVFAGSAGYTYGHNAVMQMQQDSTSIGAFGNRKLWNHAINDPGAGQMVYLKNLMLSKPYFERIPDQSLIVNQGERYDYLVATRGNSYAFVYTYNARPIEMNMGKIQGESINASWFSPRDGEVSNIGKFKNTGVARFVPPGDRKEGNDWVLIIESL